MQNIYKTTLTSFTVFLISIILVGCGQTGPLFLPPPPPPPQPIAASVIPPTPTPRPPL